MDITNILPSSMYWLLNAAPAFPVDPDKIEIITEPHYFYKTLLQKTCQAKTRITLSSLYLGSGRLEQDLVKGVEEGLAGNKDLKVLWLLDWTRGSRLPNSSRQMLLPLLKYHSCQVSLFHTPELRGLLKLLLPQRWNEVVALQHMKLYIFDDSLLISGANLSADYFSNRQDRYFLINQAPELCNFFDEVVQGNYKKYCACVEREVRSVWDDAVRRTSTRLAASGPTEDMNRRVSDQHKTRAATDTLVFPSLQMPSFNIDYDSHITERLLRSAHSGSCIHLASGYFNLTRNYMTCLLQYATAQFIILCAHPKANGFLGASGVAGAIPSAYTLLAKQFLAEVERWRQRVRVKLYEYQRLDWTFHAKGLWYSEESNSQSKTSSCSEEHSFSNVKSVEKSCSTLQAKSIETSCSSSSQSKTSSCSGEHSFSNVKSEEKSCSTLQSKFKEISYSSMQSDSRAEEYLAEHSYSDMAMGIPGSHLLPCLTLIGSPNFGWRSVHRDLESQVVLVTRNPDLQRRLQHERRQLYVRASLVHHSRTFAEPDRRVRFWVRFVVPLIKRFF
ncbi:CDP-diacylglycerol--glycerol-3-phosphate 3-phosphatidyltransferase, mitochondrial [Hyalella azteca]|uniref:CDP-diacylglycerol--glycerol-3-phosphate 3-phosphatidyltransferase n=1 Tax=Hyalella azteca TaxID=294128 RepID=A0A8B7NPD1_HYAAZ|nr:CDP-diacylglycerol--glycerol-3-phosphate 3-phosphatidyltransferase, mitochondrial [Hyalella azteca]